MGQAGGIAIVFYKLVGCFGVKRKELIGTAIVIMGGAILMLDGNSEKGDGFTTDIIWGDLLSIVCSLTFGLTLLTNAMLAQDLNPFLVINILSFL